MKKYIIGAIIGMQLATMSYAGSMKEKIKNLKENYIKEQKLDDKIFVMSELDDDKIIRCIDKKTESVLWKKTYISQDWSFKAKKINYKGKKLIEIKFPRFGTINYTKDGKEVKTKRVLEKLINDYNSIIKVPLNYKKIITP